MAYLMDSKFALDRNFINTNDNSNFKKLKKVIIIIIILTAITTIPVIIKLVTDRNMTDDYAHL